MATIHIVIPLHQNACQVCHHTLNILAVCLELMPTVSLDLQTVKPFALSKDVRIINKLTFVINCILIVSDNYIIIIPFLIDTAPRKAPSNLRYTILQSRYIWLQWDPLEAQYRGGGSSNRYSLTVSGCNGSPQTTTNTHINVHNLCPNSMYSISVGACTNIGCGTYSSPIQIQTPEDGMCMFIILCKCYDNQNKLFYSSFNCQQLTVLCH